MKNKIMMIFLAMILVLSGFLPSIVYAIDGTTTDEQVQLSFAGESTKKITTETETVTLDIQYVPVKLEHESDLAPYTEKTDLLVVNVPEGLTYLPLETTSSQFNEETNEIIINLSFPDKLEAMTFEASFKQMSEDIKLVGRHYINNVLVGQTAPVTVQKEAEVSEEPVEDVQKTEKPDVNPADEVTDQAQSEPELAVQEAAGNLDMGLATMRQLPVPQIEDGQYGNVSYFKVGSLSEWNSALTTISVA